MHSEFTAKFGPGGNSFDCTVGYSVGCKYKDDGYSMSIDGANDAWLEESKIFDLLMYNLMSLGKRQETSSDLAKQIGLQSATT